MLDELSVLAVDGCVEPTQDLVGGGGEGREREVKYSYCSMMKCFHSLSNDLLFTKKKPLANDARIR